MAASNNSSNLVAGETLSLPIASAGLSLHTRRAIINGIFRTDLTADNFCARDNGLQAWFSDWFEEQCEAAANQVSAKTHQDLLQIITSCQTASLGTSRQDISNHLRTIYSATNIENERLNASLTLSARIWLSVSIDSLQHFFTPGYFLCWNSDQSLSDALDKEFCPKPQTTEIIKLPKVFTAANLEKIAGIQVQWTSNLADHLALKDDDKKVMLFHQATFLELSRESGRTLLKDELIDETLCTLRLLIPSNNTQSRKWFNKKQKAYSLDPRAGSYVALSASERQIEKFHYWRDRLVVVKQAFDESEPNTIASWWYDDRKKVQWYTFWVAALVLLLTIFFGLIQSISGVVQAWAAVRALHD